MKKSLKKSEALRLFTHLPPDIQTRLLEHLQTSTYAAGEPIFLQGDPAAAFYLIISGRVKIVRVTPEGYENILCVRGPGDHFCPVPLLDGSTQLGTAIAMTDVTLLSVRKETFCPLCEESPELLATVQGDCLAEVRNLLHRLEIVAFRSVRERLAHALLTMSRQQSAEESANVLHLTQQELGALIGASRESVSRTLSRFERKGLVSLQRNQVIIRDRERLKKIADGERI
ncbi:MAG TPA: Crp/Fnr family transcriptional regulator [Chloroflexi bacterium]|nr:Crp/Fnr family transcriptional regulator [Chloroflexota bacterium]